MRIEQSNRRHGYVSALTLTAWLLTVSSVGALERPSTATATSAQRASARSIGNHLASTRLAGQLDTQLNALAGRPVRWPTVPMARPGLSPAPIPDSWSTLQSTGNPKVLALLISFEDFPATVSSATVQSMLFGAGDPANFPRESLRRYYERSSYDQLSLTGSVLGWYEAGQRSTVAETTAGREALIKEALDSFEASGHDFAQYDNDNDGVIDYLIVMWTGPVGAWATFWWGYQTGWQDSAYKLDGKRFGNYSWQWESSSPTVVIHETGHALGLPDYYDYDDTVGPDGGLGGLDMMDANRGDHNCFSKFLLGWLRPTLVSSGSAGLTLAPSSIAPDCLLIKPSCETETTDADAFSELFLVENRTRVATANDQSLPGDGFLIWHIDSELDPATGGFAYNNSYTSHKLIRVMEADGLEEIEAGGSGDAGDYWAAASSFSASSTPACQYYDGRACPFELDNLSAPGEPMSLDASFAISPAIFCNRKPFIPEIDPLCLIMDCTRIKPGDDVINPNPEELWIREQTFSITPQIKATTVLNPQLTAAPVIQTVKVRQAAIR